MAENSSSVTALHLYSSASSPSTPALLLSVDWEKLHSEFSRVEARSGQDIVKMQVEGYQVALVCTFALSAKVYEQAQEIKSSSNEADV